VLIASATSEIIEQMNANSLVYFGTRKIGAQLRDYILDWRLLQLGEIPRGSYIVVPHHNTGFDGPLISTLVPEKTHFWIQFENVFNSKWKNVLDIFGEIPIKVNGIIEKENLQNAIRQSRFYLEGYRQVVGIFNDGPSANLRVNGKILELEERPNYTGAAHLAKLANVPVVPISMWCPASFREEYWAWKQSSDEDTRTGGSKFRELFMRRTRGEKPIYSILFGVPLEPGKDKKAFAKEIRDKQIEGYTFLRETGK
jgi:1-acyl-sn-glycerol-3-phosphate acyltransferase